MTRFYRRIRKNNFLALPCLLFIVASCVMNDRDYGQKYVTEDLLLKVDTVTFDLVLRNRTLDSVQGSSYQGMLVGYVNDTLFGTTEMSSASFVVPMNSNEYFGIEPELKDVYLNLYIDSTVSYIYGESGIPQNLYVYEMLSPMDSNMIFNCSIRRKDYSAKPISQGAPIIFGPGSIKIKLSDEYGRKLLSSSASDLASDAAFIKKIYGLYLSVDNPNPDIPGGRLNRVSLSSSTITVNYVMNDPEREIYDRDTAVNFVFGYYYALNQFSAGSSHLESENPGEVLYFEGLAGVKPVITAADLKTQLDRWKQRVIDTMKKTTVGCEDFYIVISEAMASFPYQMPEDYESFELEHPEKIFGYRHNPHAVDSTRMLSPLDDIYYTTGGCYFDRAYMEYDCNMTTAVQKLLDRKAESVTDSLDIWIAPVSTLSSGSSYLYQFSTQNYYRLLLNGPKAERHPQLFITYAVMMD